MSGSSALDKSLPMCRQGIAEGSAAFLGQCRGRRQGLRERKRSAGLGIQRGGLL